MDWIFDAGVFIPRAQCGPWSLGMVIASIVADGFIAAAYAWLTISIVRFWGAKREVLPYAWLLIGFAAFILTCGWTHLNETLVFYWPAYRFFLVVKIVCACFSVSTALLTPAAVRYLTGYRPPEEVQIMQDRIDQLERKRRARAVVLHSKRLRRDR